MAILNLTGQATSASQIQTRITQFQATMDQWKPFWDRMPIDRKIAWVKSGKDPIMTLAWNVYKYLNNNFFQGEDTSG